MAVSAVEARLHYLLKEAAHKLYKTEFEKANLGRLISLFSDDEYKAKRYDKIKKILPREHKPLIDLLNHYRVLSAHPKSKGISHAIVKS